jgi:hypothetical protein
MVPGVAEGGTVQAGFLPAAYQPSAVSLGTLGPILPVNDELAKIELFFDEVRQRWARNAELVVARDFFVLWQDLQQPRPFRLDDDAAITLCGRVLDLVEDTGRIAFCTWDTQEMCPTLMIEGRTAVQRVLLWIQDGEPCLDEQPPTFVEDTEVTYGERLEVIYDILDHLRRNGHHDNARRLRGQVFRDALEAVACHHEPRIVRVMRQLRSESRDRLVERALTEYAIDEGSRQLELPLAGSFARPPQEQTPPAPAAPLPEAADPAPSDSGGTFSIPLRTPQEAALDLELLEKCCQVRADHRRLFVLHLGNAEVIERFPDGDLTLKVPLAEQTSVFHEGDTLNIIRHGNLTPIGELRIDLLEDSLFYGRLSWSEPGMPYPLDEYLCAMLRRGPEEFIASAVSAVAAEARQPDAALSGSLRCLLGLRETAFDGRPGPAPAHFDASQARAFASAVRESNALVFVQGPPGTGKTCVLEQVVRTLCSRGRRLLITAPSNTAVDNLCRRLAELPVLRTGYSREAVASDVARMFWHEDEGARQRLAVRRQASGSLVYAGTPIGLLRSDLVRWECEANGPFDALVYDEAGMARADEMILCLSLADRAVCFGDPMQLPPHPLEPALLDDLAERAGARLPSQWLLVTRSSLQWLTENRGFPLLLLNQSYRCQNPRLMRFASTLFYDARVRANTQAEYFALPFRERQRRFPAATLRLYRTSLLPPAVRSERLVLEGKRPGLENRLEAALAVRLVLDYLTRYPAREITVISPYRRQVRLVRSGLTLAAVRAALGPQAPDEEQWDAFLKSRIATVDSFQGGESDVVIITYVRSNSGSGIGFVGDPNRVNVTHTRARREMVVIGDSDCLAAQCRGGIFRRMVRAFERDGDVVTVTPAMAAALPTLPDARAASPGSPRLSASETDSAIALIEE